MSGKRAFVMVSVDLLALAQAGKLSDKAFRLYICMSRYVNHGRPDATIWPGRPRLAGDMGFSKVGNVDRYIAELEAAGLIRKDSRRKGKGHDTNMYTLVAPSQGLPLGQGLPPEQGSEVAPSEGVSVAPSQGPELEEVELDLEEQEPSLSPRDPDSSPVGAAPERERDFDSEGFTTQEHPPQGDHSTERAVLAKHGCTGDRAGRVIAYWSALGKGPGWFREVNKAGDMPARIADAEKAQAASSRFRAGPDGYVADSRQHGRWCGQCDRTDRMLDIGTPGYPKVTPCPTCHRDRVTGPPVEGWSTSKPQRLRGLDSRDGSTDWDDPDLLKF